MKNKEPMNPPSHDFELHSKRQSTERNRFVELESVHGSVFGGNSHSVNQGFTS